MSDDGADLNMPAEGAMNAALGGEQPERMSDEAFEARIRAATGDPPTYDAVASYAARLVLEFLEAHPEHRDTPISNEGEFRINGRKAEPWELGDADGPSPEWVKVRDGLYDVMKAEGVDLAALQLTGFMWGWAANAARHVLGLDHQPNPAIVEINV